MENYNFKKVDKKKDAEQLEIDFNRNLVKEYDVNFPEPPPVDESLLNIIGEEKDKENESITREFNIEEIKELENSGHITEIGLTNPDDESYIKLEDLKLTNEQSWDLYGRFNDIKNKQNLEKDKDKRRIVKKSVITNEDRIKRHFDKDNLR